MKFHLYVHVSLKEKNLTPSINSVAYICNNAQLEPYRKAPEGDDMLQLLTLGLLQHAG